MSIPTDAATLEKPREGSDDVLGPATLPAGGDGTFEGEIEDETYPVVVIDIKTKRSPNPFKGGEMRDQLVWLFAIVGQLEKGELAVYTSFSLHEKSHLPKVIAALGCPELKEGDPIKKSAYVGKTCRADIEMVKSKKSDKKYPRITKLKPNKK